jgi:hypothetical protein
LARGHSRAKLVEVIGRSCCTAGSSSPRRVPLLDVSAAFAQHVPPVVTLDRVTAVPAASADPQVVAEARPPAGRGEFEA